MVHSIGLLASPAVPASPAMMEHVLAHEIMGISLRGSYDDDRSEAGD